MFLQKASEMSRKLGLPRFYISANSGARIGLAEEIKPLFKVAWVDNDDFEKVNSHVSQNKNLHCMEKLLKRTSGLTMEVSGTPMSRHTNKIFTARKRSLGKGNIFTGVCVSAGGWQTLPSRKTPPKEMATETGGTHLSGMHSC